MRSITIVFAACFLFALASCSQPGPRETSGNGKPPSANPNEKSTVPDYMDANVAVFKPRMQFNMGLIGVEKSEVRVDALFLSADRSRLAVANSGMKNHK